MKNIKIICFVPARSGSTRIKNKNIRLINGRPLVYWTVLNAIKSKKFDKIIFSSDSVIYYNTLIKYLKKDKYNYDNIVFDKRDISHSKKKSKIFDYLKFDLINKFSLNNDDLLVQMLPTCPLRSIKTIKKAINYSIKTKNNCFSASEYNFHLSFGFSVIGATWKPVFKKSPLITGNTQSQSQKKFYHPNPAINCLYVHSLNKDSRSIYKNAIPILIPKSEAFDLDTEEDLKILKKIF
jgi:CMP-N,N'-diacetyllegionaminic acid synthase